MLKKRCLGLQFIIAMQGLPFCCSPGWLFSLFLSFFHIWYSIGHARWLQYIGPIAGLSGVLCTGKITWLIQSFLAYLFVGYECWRWRVGRCDEQVLSSFLCKAHTLSISVACPLVQQKWTSYGFGKFWLGVSVFIFLISRVWLLLVYTLVGYSCC